MGLCDVFRKLSMVEFGFRKFYALNDDSRYRATRPLDSFSIWGLIVTQLKILSCQNFESGGSFLVQRRKRVTAILG